MAESLFQHTSAARGKVGRRQKEYKDSIGPNGKDYYKPKTRKNAYVKVTAGSLNLPEDKGGYDALYANSSGKPNYLLNSVKVIKRGDMGMLHQLEVSFTCLSRAAFTVAEKNALRPGKPVDVSYGYTDGSDSASASGYEIVKYNYSLNNKNQYECSFTAYGPAPFVRKMPIDMAGSGFGNKKFKFGTGESPVATLPQYLKWYAQGRGSTANVKIQTPKLRPKSGKPKKVLIVDDPTKAINDMGKIMKKVYQILQQLGFFADDSSKLVYCTMEWLVETLNKYFIAPNAKNGLEGVKLQCNSTVSTGAFPWPSKRMRSGNPYNFVATGNARGDYFATNADDQLMISSDAAGMGFSTIKNNTIDCSKILISHSYIATKLFGSIPEQARQEAADAAKTVDGKKPPIKYSLEKLMETLFSDISHAFGGCVQMGLMADPGDNPGGKIINVVCKQNDSSGIKVTEFDPINGDGITRSCSVTCDIPANDAYAVANGGGTGGAGHTADKIAGRTTAEDAAAVKAAQKTLDTLIGKWGNSGNKSMMDNEAAAETVDAFTKALKTLHDQAKPDVTAKMNIDDHIWPLTLEIKIDGTHGFTFGDVVGTTFMPSEAYKDAGVSFITIEVTDTIQNNDWETTLKTQCHMFNP